MSVLEQVIARVHAASADGGAPPIGVFDLDSTLLSTQHRNWAILNEFASAPDAPPALRPILEKLSPEDMGWNIMEDIHQRGFEDLPTLKKLRKFWRERFFHDDYLRHDEPVPGAVEFVRDVHGAGGHVMYLTGRDEPGMGRGTRESLRARGFPMDSDRIHLRLKPRFQDEDLAFKRTVLAELHVLGRVVTAAENEPANANMFQSEFPAAVVFFLETVHSPNPPPLAEGIVRLKDFRR
jgi:hypothetical protein